MGHNTVKAEDTVISRALFSLQLETHGCFNVKFYTLVRALNVNTLRYG